MIFSGQAPDGTIHTDQGKQPDRLKQQLPFKIIRSKIRKQFERERKQAGDEPFHRQEVYIYIMKIRTANDIREFNAALTNCKNEVWLMGANDESYNMKNEDEYIEGMIRLTEGHDDQLGIFTDSYEDEVTMLKFFKQMAA